jgi:hypothetical protein
MTPPKPPVSRLWLGYGLLYALTLIFIGWSAYNDRLPGYLGLIPHHDTIGHFFLYGLATFLGQMICQRWWWRLGGLKLPAFPVVFTVITVIDEGAQQLSPVRTFSALDLSMSLLGIGVGYSLARRLCRHLDARSRPTPNSGKDRQGL